MPGNLTTELGAVNQILETIGESPVNTIEDSGVLDAVMARNILREVSLSVQTKGWFWNTDRGVVLTPTVPEGFLVLPNNTLEVLAADPLVNVVQRGGKLWDMDNLTFSFTGPCTVTITRLLDFTDLPQVARDYITIRSGRTYQQRVVGSRDLAGPNERDELIAQITLKQHDARGRKLTLLRNDGLVGSITNRRMGWR